MQERIERVNNTMLKLMIGDITEQTVDAIVNAANDRLILGSGVAGAINSKGGSEIQLECDKIGGTYVGGAVITTAGQLPAKKVIHAVGPMMGEGGEDRKLSNATLNSLKLMQENNLLSIAFPALSTGIFGFPVDRCAAIMLEETVKFLKQTDFLKKVIFCLWEQEVFNQFDNTLSQILKQGNMENSE